MAKGSDLPTKPAQAELPQKQAPMDATPRPGTNTTVVTQQPTGEPRPEMRSHLRGGGMTLGFNCCGGRCGVHQRCC